VNGDEPTESDIRCPETTKAVSPISAIPEVRALVNAQLRQLAQTHDCVVEGRDIGTVVFPMAAHKFYLTASPEERARRRKLDFERMSQRAATKTDAQHAAELERTKKELAERDHRDSSRAVDPLRAAEDAEVIDTTGHTIEQTTQMILQRVQSRSLAAKTS
jgi:cytidylate kinase